MLDRRANGFLWSQSSSVDEMCIYIGDVGDNTGRSSGGKRSRRDGSEPYRILKIKEPDLQEFANNESYFSILPFDYMHPSSPTDYAYSEAIFLDHARWGEGGAIGDIYVIMKWG